MWKLCCSRFVRFKSFEKGLHVFFCVHHISRHKVNKAIDFLVAIIRWSSGQPFALYQLHVSHKVLYLNCGYHHCRSFAWVVFEFHIVIFWEHVFTSTYCFIQGTTSFDCQHGECFFPLLPGGGCFVKLQQKKAFFCHFLVNRKNKTFDIFAVLPQLFDWLEPAGVGTRPWWYEPDP